MHKIFEKLKEEFFAILPPTIFFFVALHIVTFIRMLMTKGSHFEPISTVSIAVASLILGKAVLIADLLPPINRYPDKPLAYNVAWKATIYLVVAGVIHYLERLIDFSRQAGGIVPGNEKMLTDMVWPHFWAVQIILYIIVGFIVGLIARAVMPGAQQLGFILTTLLGIGGSIVGGLIGRLFSKPEPGSAFHPAGFIMSIIGAIILLFIWIKLVA